jgi:predicted nucleic acid-binding protein
MTFTDLASGERIFLDANTLVYHFAPHPTLGSACHRLLERIERADISGFTSTHVLTEVAHRLMMIEAADIHGWSATKVKQRLQGKPAALQALAQFRKAVETVLNSRIQVLTIAPAIVLGATDVSRQTGLLSNDALIVAVMHASGLTNLASHDADFDRAPGLARFSPAA